MIHKGETRLDASRRGYAVTLTRTGEIILLTKLLPHAREVRDRRNRYEDDPDAAHIHECEVTFLSRIE